MPSPKTLLAAMVTALIAALPSALAQTAAPPRAVPPPVYVPTSLEAEPDLPRTPEGRPDFQGIVWSANFFTYLQSAVGPELTLPEDRARIAFDTVISNFLRSPALALDPEIEGLMKAVDGFPIVRGQRRTRTLVLPADGRMPFTAEARQAMQSAMVMSNRADNPEERAVTERCLASGGMPPAAAIGPPTPSLFVQTSSHVVILTESPFGDGVRIIPFATAHGPAGLNNPMGDSIARWDGDTLVIETISLPDWQRIRALPSFIVNADAKVVERYTRLSKTELLYQFTVEDPKIYSAPWLAEYSLYPSPFRMFPSTCHEANYSLSNILSGQRVADARSAAAE